MLSISVALQPGSPLVSLRRVSKIFSNGTVALKDLSLDIAAPNQWNPFVAPPTSSSDALEQVPAGADTLALELEEHCLDGVELRQRPNDLSKGAVLTA